MHMRGLQIPEMNIMRKLHDLRLHEDKHLLIPFSTAFIFSIRVTYSFLLERQIYRGEKNSSN